MKEHSRSQNQASIPVSIFWSIFGIFLALFAQSIAVMIEQQLGIKPESDNTQEILFVIQQVPLMIIVSSIIGPILEEIIFRKIIFGALYKRFNFVISALISSVIFGLAHMELVHLLLYSAMGFTFAFLYVKTKRILVPIVAHVSMNTFRCYNPNLSTGNRDFSKKYASIHRRFFMRRQSPLSLGIIYAGLGILFTAIAVQMYNHQDGESLLISLFSLLLWTLDLGYE